MSDSGSRVAVGGSRGAALCCLFAACATAQSVPPDVAKELDARRLAGKAYYENDKFADAAAQFQRCIELLPNSAVDHFNLGLVLMRATKYEESLRALRRARELKPDLLGVYYIEGIIHKRQTEHEQAGERLRYVTEHDPVCMGAYYNLGVCYKFLQRYDDAVDAFNEAVKLAPRHPSSHYQLITLYRRLGQVEKAQVHREIYDQIKDTIDESEKTAEALERSRYSYIMALAPLTADLTPKPERGGRFADATVNAGLPRVVRSVRTDYEERVGRADYDAGEARDRYVATFGGGVALGDYDGDGD
ncbi:MAG: tetratricopeptide repeat protein, partial [Phycisphaerae bacterium]